MDLDLLFLRQDARHVASLTSPSKGPVFRADIIIKCRVGRTGKCVIKGTFTVTQSDLCLIVSPGGRNKFRQISKSAILQYRAVYNPTRIKFMKDIIFPRRNKVCKKKQQCLSQISFSKKEKFPTCAASCFKSLSKQPRLFCLFSIFVLRL